jgi:hypothetical protein
VVVHGGKWLLAELLRLAWTQDRAVLAEVIGQLVQLEHALVHELGGKPLVLAKGISAPDEFLVLLLWAPGNRLTRAALREYASTQRPQIVTVAITRLIKERVVWPAEQDEICTNIDRAKALFRASVAPVERIRACSAEWLLKIRQSPTSSKSHRARHSLETRPLVYGKCRTGSL